MGLTQARLPPHRKVHCPEPAVAVSVVVPESLVQSHIFTHAHRGRVHARPLSCVLNARYGRRLPVQLIGVHCEGTVVAQIPHACTQREDKQRLYRVSKACKPRTPKQTRTIMVDVRL